MKNILILYTSIGYGHKMIAENIGSALRGSFQVELVDLAELEKNSPLMERGTKFYFWMIKRWPGLWKFFYTNKFFLNLTLPLRVPVAGFKYQKVLNLLSKKHYDAVISAHVNASAILSFLKKKGLYKGKFIIAFSDFHLHWYWVYDNADLYLVNIAEQRQQMLAGGVPADKILVCGMTMQPKKQFDRIEVRKKFGLPEKAKVILVMSGSKGLMFDPKLIDQLKGLDAEILVICGKNQTLEKQMRRKFEKVQNVKVYGYLENLTELYGVTDIVVTKPGGLTVSECLQYGLPMLIHSWLPGMEQMNYQYLVERSLVLPRTKDLKEQIRSELDSGDFARQLQINSYRSAIVADGAKIRDKLTELI